MCLTASIAAPLKNAAAPNCFLNTATGTAAAVINSIRKNVPPGSRSDRPVDIIVQFSGTEPHSGIHCS